MTYIIINDISNFISLIGPQKKLSATPATMAYHKKLADEAYANDFVIHKNACEDRKLEKQLNYLERMQLRQLKKLEQEEHYFTTLHRVVPLFQQGDDSNIRAYGSRKEQVRPSWKKRVTSLTATDQKPSAHFHPESANVREPPTHRFNRKLLDLRDISSYSPNIFDQTLNVNAGKVGQSQHIFNRKQAPSHDERLRSISLASGKEQELLVTGRCKPLRERSQSSPHRLTFTSDCLDSFDKCTQYVNGNRKYLVHETDAMSLKSLTAEHEVVEANHSNDEKSVVPDSNRSDCSSGDEEVEKLPNIKQSRVMSRKQLSNDMIMLYQLKEGHLAVPKQDLTKNTHCTESQMVPYKRLSRANGTLSKSLSLDSHKNLTATKSEPPVTNINQMTLVKFLPKSKQAFYLKYDNVLTGQLCNSWHTGESS